MAATFSHARLLLLLVFTSSVCYSELTSPQAQTLRIIQSLLSYPSVLRSWNDDTDFCNTEPTSSVTVVCYEDSITQLHIIGERGAPPLPRNFSTESFFATLVRLPSLKVLTLVSIGLRGQLPGTIAQLEMLEILNISSNFFRGAIPGELSNLRNLQTLILDKNMFHSRLPNELGLLSLLAVLSVRRNRLNSSLPDSLGHLENLRVLDLSHNKLIGEVPDISLLRHLQFLDLEDNLLGPQFPKIESKNLVTLILKKNKFHSGIPEKVHSFNHLQRLDIAFNRFVGPFPSSLLSLPSITYLNIKGNKFTGMLSENMSCSPQLQLVDLSGNFLTGRLPSCLHYDPRVRVVSYARNCLVGEDKSQHPVSFCRNEALAVGIIPHRNKSKQASIHVLAISISAGIVGVIVLVAVVFLTMRRLHTKRMVKSTQTRLPRENVSTGYTLKMLQDARSITQAMKLGALGAPAYRAFSLKDIEDATNNFDTSTFVDEGSYSQMYIGKLKDGSQIAIRCLNIKKAHKNHSFMNHIEIISKLRHQHLISALGHCFDYCLDDSSLSRIFLVFEYEQNGTLRDWISERKYKKILAWSQRVAAAVGIAKGIQFLHTGIVPGSSALKLKTTDILLDLNFVAKISSHNLPLLTEYTGKAGSQFPSTGSRDPEKCDIYDLGVIILEIMVGKHTDDHDEVYNARLQLEASTVSDPAARKSIVDPKIQDSYSDESLKTVMQICSRCLLEDPDNRPSIEDVLWSLQFAAQVQDFPESTEGSPTS
ncbi:hypothetical protein DCAR_0310278 [Daucus carota subsp. sativus]|uniref:Protein kinase domain-containing protein n=1 Tax=Daucus carota subsp. sativus TaxID=79200 RepID=A0AAF0WN67_DAUCS|nr:hypothetical protein DCAR_0310278 [Daucus carota subsp. sativus]